MNVKENVTVYQCDFCKKKLFRKHSMYLHEKRCWNNPENNRACLNCTNLEKVPYQLYDYHPYNGAEFSTKVNIFKCSVKGIFMHTPMNEHKQNAFQLGEDENHPMPKECDQHATIYTPFENPNQNAW